MAKLSLSKSGLQKERNQLQLYERVLPSLDLKRQQLTIELAKAREELRTSQAQEIERLIVEVAKQLPMLANQEIALSGLVKVESYHIDKENVVGVNLPVLKELKFKILDYSMLAKPQWVDILVGRLKQMAELEIKSQVAKERVAILDKAVRRVTQRVNLFDKILIPSAKKNIKRIQIFLGDLERSAVVRSKIAKTKHI